MKLQSYLKLEECLMWTIEMKCFRINFYPYFKLYIASCCISGLKEMSINLMDNVLA